MPQYFNGFYCVSQVRYDDGSAHYQCHIHGLIELNIRVARLDRLNQVIINAIVAGARPWTRPVPTVPWYQSPAVRPYRPLCPD